VEISGKKQLLLLIVTCFRVKRMMRLKKSQNLKIQKSDIPQIRHQK